MKWLFLKIYSNGSNKDFMGWLGILNILLFPWKICQKRLTVFHSFKSCIGGCPYEMGWLNYVRSYLFVISLAHLELKRHLTPATLLKKRLWHRCFPVNLSNFYEHLLTQNSSGGCFCLYEHSFSFHCFNLNHLKIWQLLISFFTNFSMFTNKPNF